MYSGESNTANFEKSIPYVLHARDLLNGSNILHFHSLLLKILITDLS